MNLKIWPAKTLPEGLGKDIYQFICRRFNDVWSINRTDISYEMVRNRENIILSDTLGIRGCLGIEADGELVNGSIEQGLSGVRRLQKLIEFAAQEKAVEMSLYAFVPLDKSGSAVACFLAGMVVQEPVVTKKVNYHNKPIILIRLVFPLYDAKKALNVREQMHSQLTKLNEIKIN